MSYTNYFFNELFNNISEEIKTNRSRFYVEDGVKKMDLILPGYSKEDLEIKVNPTHLTIKTKENFTETKKRSKINRQFEFETAIDIETIKATMEHGILTIAFETNSKDLDIIIQ